MTEPLEIIEELTSLARSGDIPAFRERAAEAHPSDLADVFAALDRALRVRVIAQLPADLVSNALAEMEPEERPSDLLEALSAEHAADIVDELAIDDAADVIADLAPERADTILRLVDDREEIEQLLQYEEDTAGGIMTPKMISVVESVTASEAIAEIRRQSEEVEDFFQIFCTDADHRLVGVLSLRRLVCMSPEAQVSTIMEPARAVATPDLDQEEVARLMSRYNLAALPVVSETGRLLGRITFDDVTDVVEAEQTEDLLKFGGSSGHELLGGGWLGAVGQRLPWLFVNLFTASLAAFIVLTFQDTIEAIILLAVLGPVIAGMGGNAATQALAVTVRRAALGLIPQERAVNVIRKELLVGLVNGLVVGCLVGAVASLLGSGWLLGVVVFLAMWGNVIIASVAGAAIPLLLDKVGLDPAVASSVFVTAFTDMFGYFLLLGLASVLIL